MKRRFINFFIAAAVLALLLSAVSYLSNGLENDATAGDYADHPPMETVRQYLPDAATIDFLPEDDIFRVLDQAGDLTGFVVLSGPSMDAITGYSGPTPVMIALDADGVVTGVELMQNTETPGFIRQLHAAGFFAGWDGLTVEEAAAGEVDAVSGATMSSEAIAATVRGRLAMLGDGIDEERFAAYDRKIFSFQDGVILFVLLGSVLIHLQSAFLAARGWLPRVRYAWRVVSVLLLGMYSATMVSMALLDGWVNSGRIHGGIGIVVMVFLAIGWALFTGKNLYCHSICPFGALQELSFRVSPFRRRLPTALTKRLRYVRYILMFLTGLYIVLRVGLPPEMQEPFSAFRPRAAGIPAISFAVLAVLVAIAGMNRPWCAYFCSSGAMLDLLRKTVKKKEGKR